MARKNISELTPGMVLATDLTTPDGRRLMNAGAELTDRGIRALAGMGVEWAEVRAEVDEAELGRAAEWTARFFQFVNHDDPVMNRLYALATGRVAARLAEGWEPPDRDAAVVGDNEHLHDLFLRGDGGPETIVDHEEQIASFPDVYFRLRETLAKPGASAAQVAGVVAADPGLSARLLRLVNSPMYGFSSRIDRLDRAVALVGERELTTLAVGISAMNYFQDIPAELVDMRTFWEHSVGVALMATLLARASRKVPPELAFIAGLLHDVGRLLMFKKLPYNSTQALLFARAEDLPLVDAERQIFGYDHTEVAAVLMGRWNFPGSIRRAVTGHHGPSAAKDPLAAGVIQAADVLVNGLYVARDGRFCVPPLDAGVWAGLGLPVEALDTLAEDFDRQMVELLAAFL
ncbi:MAG: HDOD domain-containing protein [Desulfovibrionaceae bacterium]